MLNTPELILSDYIKATLLLTAPFTTQNHVMKKYNQAQNKSGQVLGMCQAMSNLYLGLLLDNINPSYLLSNDAKFLSAAIREENEQYDAELKGDADTEHYAFRKRNIPHSHQNFQKNKLTSEQFHELLEKSQHLLITYPTSPDVSHQVYLGKETPAGAVAKSRCRFFDANMSKGERVGPCPQIIEEFIKMSKIQYFKQDKPFSVGMST